MSLSPNDLILSGILDVPTLISEKSLIMKALKKAQLWKSVNEPIELLSLPDNVEQFVNECIKNKNKTIEIPKRDASLFVRIRNLVDSMDAITSQESLERNGVKGPVKKYDIFGVCKSENYDLELILGEISYGPLDETYKHSIEDRIKLGKGAKDSLDNPNV
ncbi:14745_t:CDS:2 [Racocetra fulgida]|uniref:14745_t:CDS:1 n=1 Tax=Racocetra fulgida TaxID=60492 RepID=A0A9N8VUD1_9GLOM|nr:14745_t:CDS:2 [Racocetra fulgida]